MRKTSTLFKIMLAGIGAIGLATSSWAAVGQTACSTNNLIAGQNDITVASQLITATSAPEIDLGAAGAWPGNGAGANRNLLYAPNIDVTTDSTIKFDFVNFAIKKTALNKYYLRIAGATDGAPAGSTWQVGTLVDFASDAAGNYTSMTFKVVAHDENGDAVLDAGIDDRIGAAQVVAISQSDVAYDNPVIVVNKSLSEGATGTMSVPTVKDATSTEKEAPRAPTQVVVFTVVPGLTAAMYNPADLVNAGYATSTIDVDPAAAADARKVFVADPPDTPTTTTSAAVVRVTNNGEYGFTLDASDSWTFTIQRSNTDGVTGITIGGAPLTNTGNTWHGTATFGVMDLTANRAVVITVNGTTILQNGTWTVDLTVNPGGNVAEDALADITLMSGVTSHVWDTNGAQFQVGYLHNDVVRYGTSLVVTNRFASAAGIQMDVWTDAGATATGISLGSLAGSTTKFLTATDIQAAAQAAIPALALSNGSHRYMAIFTVNAPASQITATALQNMPSGDKRTLPVQFTNTAAVHMGGTSLH